MEQPTHPAQPRVGEILTTEFQQTPKGGEGLVLTVWLGDGEHSGGVCVWGGGVGLHSMHVH